LVFASSLDTTKPALSGILLRQEKDGFLLVATDGFRLSLKRHPATTISNEVIKNTDTALIVPARIFKELSTIREEASDVGMFVAKASNQVVFEIGETLVIGRLIEATYPNYERIIPLDFSAQVQFEREELQKAVKICSIFAKDNANIIKLSLKKDMIVVSAQTASVGENTVSVEASLSGEENEIAFNARYLQDVLGNVNAERMVFAMTGPLNPGVFKIENDESYLHLIMPIRVQQ
jgi:DNA polymerase-3 subunit beta